MQPILEDAPYYAEHASDEGRLFLVRTKGSLSGGTRVTVVSAGPSNHYAELVVSGKVRVPTHTAPHWKETTEEVTVTLDDLVIRRMTYHPDMLNVNKPTQPRSVRRQQQLASARVLVQLKEKYGGKTEGNS